MDPTVRFYSQPTYAVGGGFPVFAGSRRQRGGGIFGSLAKMVLPVIKTVGSAVLRNVGGEVAGLARDVAQTALSGRGMAVVRQTLQRQGLKRLQNVGQHAIRTAMNEFSSTQPPPPEAAVNSARLRKR